LLIRLNPLIFKFCIMSVVVPKRPYRDVQFSVYPVAISKKNFLNIHIQPKMSIALIFRKIIPTASMSGK